MEEKSQEADTFKQLSLAIKNYRLSVRWYREVLAYRATVRGDEWKSDGKWLANDAELAYNEAVKDIKKYRKLIVFLKKKWENEWKVQNNRKIGNKNDGN